MTLKGGVYMGMREERIGERKGEKLISRKNKNIEDRMDIRGVYRVGGEAAEQPK